MLISKKKKGLQSVLPNFGIVLFLVNENMVPLLYQLQKEPYFVEPFLQIALQGLLDLGFFSNYTQRTLKESWTTCLDPF